MRSVILHLLTAQITIVGWAYVLLATMLGFAKEPSMRGWIMTATWRDWWADRWPYATTAGRGIIAHPEHANPEEVWEHECVHVRQAEDIAVAADIYAIAVLLLGHPWWALAVWASALVMQLIGYLTAALRYGTSRAYRDAEHERAAYAQQEALARSKR